MNCYGYVTLALPADGSKRIPLQLSLQTSLQVRGRLLLKPTNFQKDSGALLFCNSCSSGCVARNPFSPPYSNTTPKPTSSAARCSARPQPLIVLNFRRWFMIMGLFRKSKQSNQKPTREEALRCIPEISPDIQWHILESGDVFIEYPLSNKPFFVQLAKRFHPESAQGDKVLTRKLQLDQQGSRVWQLLDGKRNVAQVIEKFASQEEISLRDSEHSITLFFRSLGKRGLILMRRVS